MPPEPDPQYNKEFARARVVLPGPDQIEILTSRYPDPVTVDPFGNPSNPLCARVISDDTGYCFDSDSNTWAWRSQDNGLTLGTPMVFSHAAPGGDVAVFNTPTPVIGSVTETTTGGTFFASAAPGGDDRTAINLGDGGPDRAYHGTLAAPNDGVPVAGFADLNSNIFVRTHIGSDPSTFNDLLTTSGRFAATSAPPLVRTVSPAAGSTFRAGAPVILGEAFDPTGRALNRHALTWSSGATVLGHGRLIVAAGLAPGRRRLTLTARGPGGGIARAGLVVRVTPARPLFTVLRAPGHVSAKAKSVVLSVATTPLTAGRLHVTVGRTPSRVRIPIKRGRSGLQLTLRLGSGGLASRQTVLITRS